MFPHMYFLKVQDYKSVLYPNGVHPLKGNRVPAFKQVSALELVKMKQIFLYLLSILLGAGCKKPKNSKITIKPFVKMETSEKLC